MQKEIIRESFCIRRRTCSECHSERSEESFGVVVGKLKEKDLINAFYLCIFIIATTTQILRVAQNDIDYLDCGIRVHDVCVYDSVV